MSMSGPDVAQALVRAFGSLRAAADYISVSQSTIWRWSIGRSSPSRCKINRARIAIEQRAEELTNIAGVLRP